MDRIIIKDGVTSVIMPKTINISVGGKLESKEVEMSSGKIVSEVKGCRIAIDADWDYVSADIMTKLITMLRKGKFLVVEYPDVDGSDKSGYFKISIPSPGIFKFVDGVPMWHGISLSMLAQEVL